MYNQLSLLIANVGFPIVVTLILLKCIIPAMARTEQIEELKTTIFRLDRNLTVMTIVIARATGIDYNEAKRWVYENNNP